MRLLVSLLAFWLAVSQARPADQSTDEANVVPTVSGSVSTVRDDVSAAGNVLPTVGPTPFPYAPNPFAPALNNPYYKYNPSLPGPAVPILTYSDDHRPDGSYSYR
ncbi:unnamed protein product [Diatraea saccharalis]|uniref:Uncharacterized protein n=1 Tax=Diatraea saccharalis TaxID=40085 RepID=A0A9N9QX71_9NEOP|nr:unnamed protein product [Diatraea saccharalis]